MSFCKDCISGVRLEGTPEGKFEKVGGVDAYIATPTIDYPKDAVVLLLTDVFGVQLSYNQLLADDFAKNGFKVVMIDLFNGDPLPQHVMSPDTPGFDLQAWREKHDRTSIAPSVKAAYTALSEGGITKFYLAGYGFGGRVAFNIACQGFATAVSVSHPAFTEFPEVLEKYKSSSKAPLLINSCEVDYMFPTEAQAKADEIMTGFAPGYKRTYWEGCTHGFAVRGDMTNPKVKAGKEGAFKATVMWFIEH